MKFFSTALAAFAVGSAVAAPILDALTTPCTSCKDESGVGAGAGTPDVPSPCTAPGLDIGVPNPGQVGSGGHVDNADVIVVVEAVVEAVITVEAKVKGHLDLVASVLANADLDVDAQAQALLNLLVVLQVDLKDLIDCVPTLNGLTLDVDVLVAAQLQVILDLVVRVQALIAEVEVCLEGLVALHADILVIIGAELHACLDVIVAVANPVVEFALAVVAIVTATVHVDIIAKINGVVGDLTNNCSVLGGVLAPVFKLVNL